jgi:3-hydroxyisobutyrate dehydrogenase
MSTLGFIGLGAMGSRMAMNLLAAGHELRVYNRDRLKTLPFKEKGVHVCESPAEAAEGAAFVVSIVADDDATRDVMLGGQGVLSAAAKGAIVIDSSTNTPAMAKEVAAAAADEGIAYLDAPVSGSIAQAQGKELVFLVGGDKTAFEKAQPVMAAMGKMARRIGGPGAGATVKLINNMLGATLTAAIGEAAMAVEAADLDRDAVIEVLNEGAAGSRLTRAKLPKIFKRDFAPQFQLELMEKDLRYYLALAQALDRPSPIASLIRSQYQAARRAQLGKLDSCAVFLQAAGEKPKG